MGMIRIGVIGYGVRMDMLMDQLSRLCVEAKVVAVADKNPDRVKALMCKNSSALVQHKMEIDKIDGLLRKCPMDPDKITFYKDAEEMLDKEQLDGVMLWPLPGWSATTSIFRRKVQQPVSEHIREALFLQMHRISIQRLESVPFPGIPC